MNDKYKDFFQSAESIFIQLEGVTAAVVLLGESLEEEGWQPADKFDNIKAGAFIARFPMHLALFDIIQRELNRLTEETRIAINRVCSA